MRRSDEGVDKLWYKWSFYRYPGKSKNIGHGIYRIDHDEDKYL